MLCASCILHAKSNRHRWYFSGTLNHIPLGTRRHSDKSSREGHAYAEPTKHRSRTSATRRLPLDNKWVRLKSQRVVTCWRRGYHKFSMEFDSSKLGWSACGTARLFGVRRQSDLYARKAFRSSSRRCSFLWLHQLLQPASQLRQDTRLKSTFFFLLCSVFVLGSKSRGSEGRYSNPQWGQTPMEWKTGSPPYARGRAVMATGQARKWAFFEDRQLGKRAIPVICRYMNDIWNPVLSKHCRQMIVFGWQCLISYILAILTNDH